MATTIMEPMPDLKKAGKTLSKANLGLKEDQRSGSIDVLNAHLADLNVFYVKLRNYHWNVTGPQFRSLHLLFEEQYTAVAATVDEVAERVRSLGGFASGTMGEFLKNARLSEEKPGVVPPAREMIANLVADHEAIIQQLREDIDKTADEYHDQGTSDFLTGLMEAHEKMAWMLRALLEGEPV
jgi:starvation-inducible DNA-binding protein